tara:strand:- start:2880 stop:3140 length:261 start_codon:yes stop_codon:yes gene_type:complete
MTDLSEPMDTTRKRHIAKTITWRVIASLTTFCLALFFFKDDPMAASKATGVAVAESLIKMVLYYYHERFWYKSNFGLTSRKLKKNG